MSTACQVCGTVPPPGAKFCAQCGTALAPRCPSCGAEHAAGAKFCGNCGKQLIAAPATAATASAAIERRHMTFMFCDLVGSTELSQAIDAEDLREIVADYREAASGAVSRHEGTVAQFYGDGILVYFGYPVAHEDDGRRAVQAAIEILDAVAKLNTRLRTERPVSLAVRIGVHTGVAIVGDVGGANRTERLAMGDTPNITARIQGLASPNAIVISAATHQLVRDYFTTRSLGPQTVKGVAGPIEAFEVVGPTGAAAKAERTAGRGLTAYVGRETVLEPLRDAWKSACAGQGRVVVVTGDAGVGKSRLIRVFREGLSAELLHSLECFCSPYHENSALHPMVEMFRTRLRLGEENDPKLHLERLRSLLVEHRLDTEGALPLAAQLVRIPPDAGYTPLALHPLTQKQRNLELLQSLILAPAERRPTLLLVEDAHWIDPTTLEMLGGLLERVSGHRILVVMTARPTFRVPWQPRESLITLTVRDLSPADTEAMVRALTGGKKLPPQVLSMLVSKSDGNPLFVEEMTRMLLESGWLSERDDAFVLTGPMPEASVPTRLQDLLRARLDRLEPEARLVMQLASVVGRDFTYELLAEVLPAEGQTLRRGLQQLLDAGLVFATGSGFTIKHELIKDAAYESLLRRTRQQYHERVATALEGTFAAAAQGQPERLAQHWTRAGQAMRAVPYWLQAGQKAVASSAVEEAASHLHHGLELLKDQPASIERDRLELDLLSTLGTALTIQKGWAAPEVADAYSRAHALSERVGDSPSLFWVLWGLWAFYLVKGDQHQGLEFAERMMAFAKKLGDEGLELEAHFSLGLSHYYMGKLARAREHLDHAVATYVIEKHHPNCFLSCQDVGVTSLSVASMVRYLQGDDDLAMKASRDAVALAESLRHPFSQAYALGCAAWLHSYRRDLPASLSRAQDTMALSQAQALGWWLLWGMILAGRGMTAEGKVAEGIAQMESALGMYRGVGSGMVVPYFLTQLAEAHALAGNYAAALEKLADARQLVAAGGEAIASAEIDRLEGEIRLQAGETPSAAQPFFDRGLATARAQGAVLFERRILAAAAVTGGR